MHRALQVHGRIFPHVTNLIAYIKFRGKEMYFLANVVLRKHYQTNISIIELFLSIASLLYCPSSLMSFSCCFLDNCIILTAMINHTQ